MEQKRKQHYLDKLFIHFEMTAKKFSESLGIDRPERIYNVLRGRNKVSSDLANLIIAKYPNINYAWLLTGEGDMLKESEIVIQKAILYLTSNNDLYSIRQELNIPESTLREYKEKTKVPTIDHAYKLSNYFEKIGEKLPEEKLDVKFYEPENLPMNRKLIPLWDDISSVGGRQQKGYSANMQSNSPPTEWIDPGDWFKNATAAIRHYGESMTEYPPGCILALKEVYEKQLIVWGKDYVIETNEYRITKRVQRGNSSDFIKAYSSNIDTYPDGRLIHEPVDIAWKDIRGIYLVLGYVVKNGNGTMVFTNKK